MATNKKASRDKVAKPKKGKKPVRGARALPDPGQEASTGVLRIVAMVGLLAMVASGLGYAAHWLWQQAPSVAPSREEVLVNVRVEAPFRAVSEKAVEDILLPHLRKGFFAVDIDGVRSALMDDPWIVNASVSRRWPHGVEVVIEEAEPLAIWGDDHLLVASGALLPRPENLRDLRLPELAGDADLVDRIMMQYQALAGLLTTKDMEVRRLSFDDLAGWQLELVSGIRLQLGHDELLERVGRFLSLTRGVLAPHLQKIAGVDARYNNAVAVQWKETEQAKN
ncbi:FtsQ-type POTRA domain-containing protein [Microbulbifer agarilyticus]|uniref:cell division protein FtsQ/DivIB n=1 Tax=Microbulbifer agarilyticus TaxID=260552 RepID=UPI001C98DE10|nr:FtsQ-type POTRA domain-containing protein [Microbulbifer agarilyticus]MBY6191452.1 FtsQ-type POTRA domain-containing protein [Microbulbifer agarilyticus]